LICLDKIYLTHEFLKTLRQSIDPLAKTTTKPTIITFEIIYLFKCRIERAKNISIDVEFNCEFIEVLR